ncbi:hypothetical protein HPP92_009109 [Vanilla planifolia]|uniref:Myb/SANT-like DNA-binding domain-containing protein n=1 Tax=Vanilla planifolia TaxID=51239 RepID=A0A835R3V6_VANPL|nr:hypothetical protein HPP92_009109 [Vanilla planifolia]
MDDTEDDAGYPPNPYRGSHRRSFPTSNHSKAHSRNNSHRSQMPRGYPGDHGNEDDDEVDQAMNDAEDEEYDDDCNAGQEHLGTRSQLYVDHEEVGHDSSESKGKRRKLDRYTGGYELVARSAPTPALKPLPSRSSSAEWSEDSTFALLNSWGDRYLQNGRKSLRSDEWVEVAKTVCQGSKVLRSEAQCRNRLDTLKKRSTRRRRLSTLITVAQTVIGSIFRRWMS